MVAFNFNMVAVILSFMAIRYSATAVQHIVGDANGWVIPMNRSFYTDWASMNIFTIGDSLVFDFPTGTHDVAEVSKDDYDHCHVSNPGSTIKTGPATISLTVAGDHYYICSLEGHCLFGQSLAINVGNA
ncbi:umecyanin-like [Bidens hawaiensis]|uniref:umecyanin-like n=1 Tax=Bidens hawaiensis TaxID=980011 RepID=UPI00404A7DD6